MEVNLIQINIQSYTRFWGKDTLPNLVDKFIYGGTNADIGTEGGEATHTLTIDEMPSHAHGYSDYQPRTGQGRGGGTYTVGIVEAWRDTVAVGGSQSHNNIPPYVKLLYCISTGGGILVYIKISAVDIIQLIAQIYNNYSLSKNIRKPLHYVVVFYWCNYL